jgi:hypothetical protein
VTLLQAPTEDKGRKIRPFCDMIMVPSPPPAYCRQFCTLCGPRIYSEHGKMKPPGKESWFECMKECAKGKEWVPRLVTIRNGPEWRPDWIEFKEKMAAKWEASHPHEDFAGLWLVRWRRRGRGW